MSEQEVKPKVTRRRTKSEPKVAEGTVRVKVKRLSPDAIIPEYKTAGAAAFDLASAEDIVIDNCNITDKVQIVRTDLAFEIPEGYVGILSLRSGTGVKTKLRMSNAIGVIDSDYRGAVGVPLEINSRSKHLVNKGDRIAQMMILPVPKVCLEEVEELSESDRGEGGFGSTGVK